MLHSVNAVSMRTFTTFILMAFVVSALLFPPTCAFAVQPDEVLRNTELEKRARNLSAKLRCLVCQNQSIDDSDAPLARDLRLLVRERLVAGDSDDEVVGFLVARYGEFVLLKPSWGPHTFILWLSPLLVLLLGIFLARRLLVSSSRVSASQDGDVKKVNRLSEEDEERLKAILEVSPDARLDK